MPTVINGSTGIDKVQDGTIVQADLAANVAGTGPCFSAYQSVAQSIPNAAYTKLQLQIEEFDTHNAFDNVTNHRFQPTVAGYYFAEGNLLLATAAPVTFPTIYKNGVVYARGNEGGTAAGATYGASVATIIYLNGSTDYLELFAFQALGSSNNTDINPYRGNRFSAVLVRAA